MGHYYGDEEVYSLPPVTDPRIVDVVLEVLREGELREVIMERVGVLELFAVEQFLIKVKNWFNDSVIGDIVEGFLEDAYLEYGGRFLCLVAKLVGEVDVETGALLMGVLKRVLGRVYRGESLGEVRYLIDNLGNCDEVTIRVLRGVIRDVFKMIYEEHGSEFVDLLAKCFEKFDEGICRILNEILAGVIREKNSTA